MRRSRLAHRPGHSWWRVAAPALAVATLVLGGVRWSEAALSAAEARAQILAAADARRFDRWYLAFLARHPDPGVRSATARLVGQLANPGGVSLLEHLSGNPQGEVREAAAEAAGHLYPELLDGAKGRHTLAELLHRLLDDREARVRRAAGWAIALAGPEHAGRWLVDRIRREGDAGVRAALLEELWRTHGAEWVGVATAALGDVDPKVRLAAAWSLSRSSAAAVAPALRQAARDPQPGVRIVALEAARRGHAVELWEELCAAVEDQESSVRTAALGGLAAALEADFTRRLPAAVSGRLRVTVADRDPERVHERLAAISLAGLAGEARAALRELSSGDDFALAGPALQALARESAELAAPVVNEWLGSSELPRRLAAVGAARFLPGATNLLTLALADSSPAVRLAAIDEVGTSASKELVPELGKRLGDDDAAVRAAAVEALASLGAPVAPGELPRLLARERGTALPDAAVALIDALASRPDLSKEARQELDSLLHGKDPVVARAAWAGLRKHGIKRDLPTVAPGQGLAFYREVVAWASKPRWLEVVTVRGTMQVSLDTASAPLACYRLAALAEGKYFDGLTFHRVVANFVIQGGDPRGDGWGGPGFVLRDELSLAPYQPGSVGLALSGPDTGGSQLFVTLTAQPHLIGRYPHLGEVVAGLEVANRIRRGDRIVRVRAGEGALPAFYPLWYGLLTSDRLDGGILGWRAEREHYTPSPELIEKLASARLHYSLVVAMGTWCSDSREQIPRLQAVLAALGPRSPFDAPRLIGIDRSKTVPEALYPFGEVDLVPTIVVTLGSSEVGRIVETPVSGTIEEDLVRIVAPVEGWPAPDAAQP